MKTRHALFLALSLALAASVSHADSLGSAFTYDGQLDDAGAPANGSYDVEFALYAAASGGTPLDVLARPQLAVAQGRLRTSLDFTDVPYNGQALWIEVRVRASDSSDAFTALNPRQPITATPYALYALNAAPATHAGAAPATSAAARTASTGAAVPVPGAGASPQDNGTWTLPFSGTTSSVEGNPAAAMSIIETGPGLAIYGQAVSAAGVRGLSVNGNGLRGDSTTLNGVYGLVGSGSGQTSPHQAGVVGDSPVTGVYGLSSATSFQSGAALTGVDTSGGPGLYSYVIAPGGTSIIATNDSANDQGDIVQGWHKGAVKFHGDVNGNLGAASLTTNSATGPAVSGTSSAGDGVQGYTTKPGASALAGHDNGSNAASNGVYGFSNAGTGIRGGSGSGYAMTAEEATTQARNQGGWVKAMIVYLPAQLGGPRIERCFNSQLPAAQASTPPCGFSTGEPQAGNISVNFGFKVDDRFLSMTGLSGGSCFFSEVIPTGSLATAIFNPNGTCSNFDDAEFSLVVF